MFGSTPIWYLHKIKIDTHFKFSIVWGQFQFVKKTKCWHRNRRLCCWIKRVCQSVKIKKRGEWLVTCMMTQGRSWEKVAKSNKTRWRRGRVGDWTKCTCSSKFKSYELDSAPSENIIDSPLKQCVVPEIIHTPPWKVFSLNPPHLQKFQFSIKFSFYWTEDGISMPKKLLYVLCKNYIQSFVLYCSTGEVEMLAALS